MIPLIGKQYLCNQLPHRQKTKYNLQHLRLKNDRFRLLAQHGVKNVQPLLRLQRAVHAYSTSILPSTIRFRVARVTGALWQVQSLRKRVQARSVF